MSHNPFLEDPVIRVMLEEADIATLKTFREMNDNWNRLDIKELTNRALQGQMKELTIMHSFQDKIDRFLVDTRRNPQLFRSFGFFLESLKNLDLTFFSKYHPIILTFYMYEDFKLTDHAYNYWLNMLTLVSPHLQELRIIITEDFCRQLGVFPCSLPVVIQPVFPSLTQLGFFRTLGSDDIWWNQLTKPLIDKCQKVDPTPALINLEISSNIVHLDVLELTPTAFTRWCQLTELSIHLDKNLDHSKRIMDAFLAMAEKGLALKAFSLIMVITTGNDWNGNIVNLSHFLDTQAKSLRILDFLVYSYSTFPPRDATTKIKLPIFKRVHSLTIHIVSYDGPGDTSMFEMGQLPVHFPRLEHLTVDHDLLPTLFSDGLPSKSLPLESLYVQLNQYYHETDSFDRFVQDFDFESWKEWLRTKFESVKVFKGIGSMLGVDGAQLPWGETLEKLKITDVNAPIKVSYLSNLRKISVTCNKFEEEYMGNPAQYLSFFEDLLNLPLSSIKFDLCMTKIPKDVKVAFVSYFPFPVEFKYKISKN